MGIRRGGNQRLCLVSIFQLAFCANFASVDTAPVPDADAGPARAPAPALAPAATPSPPAPAYLSCILCCSAY